MEDSLQQIKGFRQNLYSAITYRKDACFQLIDSLSSNIAAKTPVQLSLNSHFERTYSSITDVLSEFHKGGQEQQSAIDASIFPYAKNTTKDYFLSAIDATPAVKKYAKALQDRTIIYQPNAICGNKPINIGHKFSALCHLPDKNDHDSPWVLPLAINRINSAQTDAQIALEQIDHAIIEFNKQDPDKFIVNTMDSGYSHPQFIHNVHAKHKNIITIIRAKSNRVIWQPTPEKILDKINKKGADQFYGNRFAFKDSSSWHEPDTTESYSAETKHKKKLQ